MSRYLLREDFEPILNLGRSIECFLGGGTLDGEFVIRWVSIRRNEASYLASLWEVWDPTDPGNKDVYAFRTTGAEPDEPLDERHFEDLDAAIEFSEKEWGANTAPWVNEGMVQEEYADYLSRRA